jgi:hypothetical protein
MSKLLTFAAAFILICSGCDTQDDPNHFCPQGTIRLNNNSNDPYSVYFDGSSMGIMQGQTTADHVVDKGAYSIRVVQLTGYVSQPNEKVGGTIIEGCDTDIFTFP